MSLEISITVDNWGNHMLNKLRESYKRQEYCDLTLKFCNNEERKVHRVVVNACTDYFKHLEKTFKVHKGCLVMPSNLEAHILLPIIDYMYSGQLTYPRVKHGIFRTYSVMMNMPMLTCYIDQGTQKALEKEKPHIQLFDTLLYEKSPFDALSSDKHSDTKAFKITTDSLGEGTDGRYESVCISATKVDLSDKNLNGGKDAILAITTEVVRDTDSPSSDWSDEDLSQDTNENANCKNNEAMPQELLSQNDSRPNVTWNPEAVISSLLHDCDCDSQEDDQIDKSEPSTVDTENVSVAEVNSESQKFINNL